MASLNDPKTLMIEALDALDAGNKDLARRKALRAIALASIFPEIQSDDLTTKYIHDSYALIMREIDKQGNSRLGIQQIPMNFPRPEDEL